MATATTLANPCAASHTRPGGVAERAESPVGDHVLAVHAETEAGDGDADLRRGNVAVLPGADRRRTPWTSRASGCFLRRARIDRRPRRADDGELRRDEDRVEGDQHRNDDEGRSSYCSASLRRRRRSATRSRRSRRLRFPRAAPRSSSSSPGSGIAASLVRHELADCPAVLRPCAVDPDARIDPGERRPAAEPARR